MIYDFIVTMKNNKGKKVKKQFYLTADNKKHLYRLIQEMYRLKPEDIYIQNEIEDENIDINKPKREIKYNSEATPNIIEELNNLLDNKIYGRPAEFFKNKEDEGFKVVVVELNETDIIKLLSAYKKVKIYYLRTGAKKNKQYLAVCK